MAYTRDFPAMELALRQLGQWEGSSDVTPEICLQAINYGLLEAYDIMVQKWADYYTLNTDFALTAGQDTYPIVPVATSFYKLRHMSYTRDTAVTASSRFVRMLPFDIEAQASYSGTTQTSGAPRYRIQATNFVFAPVPSGGTVRLFYIPLAPQYLNVEDDIQQRFDSPIEERLVIQIAQREILERNDLPTNDCDAKIAKLSALLRTAADSRDAGHPYYLDPRGPRRDWDWGSPDDEGWWA